MNDQAWYLRTQDETFGPESKDKLIEWAQLGRVLPGQEVSDDNIIWRRVEEVPFLDMRFSIDIGDGNPRGPFNRRAAEALLASGRLPSIAKLVEVREPFPEEEVERVESVESVEEAEEVVEEVVEKVVEVPVEKVVEVPVEKVVEKIVEKVVVDETRVKELEALLDEERRRTMELQVRLDAATKDAELQREEFQQKAEAAAREAEAALETARQKAEISAQDADARLASVQAEAASHLAEKEQAVEAVRKESAERLAEKEAQIEAVRKESAERLEAAERKTESVRRDLEAQLESARQARETAQKEADARMEDLRGKSEAELKELREKSETALKELREKSEAELKELREKSEAVQKEADARETKSREQIVALENELRRLPQAASEIADVQAAVYSLMTKEAAELAELIEAEKRESDEYRKRQQERADRLLERRRELLKRTGANIEDMTRKALVERPEDPRTVQLRREYEEFRRADEKKSREYEDKLLAKSREIEELRRELSRRNVADKDATQLQGEVVALREKLQRCEKDLLSERQICEELRQRQATNQQVLMARLATLESPTIAPAGTAHVPETRQSREAKAVKLPRWMQLGGKR